MNQLPEVQLEWDGREFELQTSIRGLGAFIECLSQNSMAKYQLEVQGAQFIPEIELCQSDGKLRLNLIDGRAALSASENAYKLLIDNLQGLLNLWVSGGMQHLHFEPASSSLLMEDDSEAFVVTRLE